MVTPDLDPRRFKKITYRNTSLPLALAVLLGATFVGIILHLVSLSHWVDHTNQLLARANRALLLMVDGETGLRGYIITHKQVFLDPYFQSVENVKTELSELKQLTADNPSQSSRIDRIRESHQIWSEYANQMLKPGQAMSALRLQISSEHGKKIMDSIRQQFSEFIHTEETLREQRTSDTQKTVELALFIVVTVSLITGLLLALHAQRQLNRVADIYGGVLQKQSEQNEALERQAWLRIAQATLADRTRGDQSLLQVCSEILAVLCSHLEAKAATLYVAESPTLLKRSAAYALSEAEMRENQIIERGTTLVGQVARDRKLIQLEPAPVGHLKVTSSLGDSSPQSILIAPAIFDEKIKAVMEFALSRPIASRDSELLELLSENIGAIITSAQYRVQLKQLLEESQRQAEELQSQQEELRVNNEELEEQAKALKESQFRLENQQSELEQTNTQLTVQARSLEKQNDSLAQTRADLEQKAKDLEKTSQYKSQFLANMSHELRTPLNSTLILSQLLMDNQAGRLGPEELDYAKTILSSSHDLLELINEILDLAKVESGTIELHMDTVSIHDLMQTLDRAFSPMAEKKGIQFDIEANSAITPTLHTDRLRLEQILKNLISNAVKFTQVGSVKLRVEEIPGETSPRLAFLVSDTGIGIPENKKDVIFEAFQQADGTTSRTYGGTGLGLAISKDLAGLLGGSIQVESTVGKGSTFTLQIPLNSSSRLETVTNEVAPSPAVSRKPALSFPDDRGHRDPSIRLLLIVEDDDAFAKILLKLSHERSFQAIVAQTAEDAVDLAIAHLPHAIILDMNLPDHNGLFVLDRLKENPATRHIPVHIVSAQDHSLTSLQMGAIGYLMKPAARDQLMAVIQKLEAKVSQTFKTVLIVEDNDVQRESMKRLLSHPGVEVLTADTGQAALSMLESKTVDCVVLDLSLPDMTGYEILEKISLRGTTASPPVIVYTARSLTREEEEKLQRYSRSIILKGAKSPERLLSEVSLFLHHVESEMPTARQKVLQELRDREKTLEGRTILVVDDDVRNIYALNSALQPRGAKTEIARNGKEALAKLEANPAIELVLMDIMMPEMDGYEAIRRIRTNPKLRKLPIIAVTAKAMSDDQEKCMEAGASDYLAKPLDLSKLLSLMKVWLPPIGGITQ